MAKWTVDPTKIAKVKEEDVENVRKTFAFILFSSLVKKTPVDTGRARGNWQISFGSPSKEKLGRTDKKKYGTEPGAKLKKEEQAKLDKGSDDDIYISNNLPYMACLEYGGYPSPVKKGTWNKKTKKYEIRSDGGFSRQSPQGMVGVTVANAEAYYKRAVDIVNDRKGGSE